MKSKLIKILMHITIFYYLIFGFLLSFFPQEIGLSFNVEIDQFSMLVCQILGAVFLGNGVMNWMLKSSKLGGIYNRLLVFCNFLHFFTGTFALIKSAGNQTESQLLALLSLSGVYLVLAFFFAYLLFLKK